MDEIVAELEKIELAITGEGLTVAELSEQLGKSKRWVRDRLGELIGRGRAVCSGSRTQIRIDNRPNRVPLYKLVKDPKKKG